MNHSTEGDTPVCGRTAEGGRVVDRPCLFIGNPSGVVSADVHRMSYLGHFSPGKGQNASKGYLARELQK